MEAATERPQEATAEGERWPSHVESFAALGREQQLLSKNPAQ